ncbi:Fibrobacter succinogenes major domain [compost metagenome]
MERKFWFCTLIFLGFVLILTISCSKNDDNKPSDAVSVTDIDGNVYHKVTIGTQVWMKENLNVSRYRNGDIIPQEIEPAAWLNLTIGAWCYYENNTANGSVYGKLYNWYAVNDPRGLAPTGWHVPSDTEWATLTTYLGGQNVAGAELKEAGTTHWMSPNTGATNRSGFTALPGGVRQKYGDFFEVRQAGFWWSSTEAAGEAAWYRQLYYDTGGIGRPGIDKKQGYSVRCLKD